MVEDPIAWLDGLERFGIKLGLDSMRALLRALGNPESAFPSVIVGGTNGKGSVAAMLDAMLLASGRRTGLYTSPHLVRVNERIRIAGADLGNEDLHRHLTAVRSALEDALEAGLLPAHPSFFEVVTATALRAFRDAGVDLALLEVGLGGRLDATNVVEAILSVIVTVDLDHTDRLGATLEEIAFEKAGIAKTGRVLVSGVAQKEAVAVLRRECASRGARLLEVQDCARIVEDESGSFTIETEHARYEHLAPALPGRHQLHNTAVAVVALEALGRELEFAIAPEVVREGLRGVRWPGRLQWIDGRPRLLLDGAHNPAGARSLVAYLRGHDELRPVLLFGAMKDKDAAAMLWELSGSVEAAILTRPPSDRAADPAELAAALGVEDPVPEIVPQPAQALRRAREIAGPDGVVLVAGSLYLVGEVLRVVEHER